MYVYRVVFVNVSRKESCCAHVGYRLAGYKAGKKTRTMAGTFIHAGLVVSLNGNKQTRVGVYAERCAPSYALGCIAGVYLSPPASKTHFPP